LSPTSVEYAARVATLFDTMTYEQQNNFLERCNLLRAEKSSTTAASTGSAFATGKVSGQQQHEVNRLVVSPAGTPGSPSGPSGRLRSHEALRLVHDDNTISTTYKGRKMIVVAGDAPRSEDDVRCWFQTVAQSDDTAVTIPKETFRSMYLSLDSFGVPPRVKWLEEQLAKIEGDDIAFEDFYRLVEPLVSH
jgi:hypothetical protein